MGEFGLYLFIFCHRTKRRFKRREVPPQMVVNGKKVFFLKKTREKLLCDCWKKVFISLGGRPRAMLKKAALIGRASTAHADRQQHVEVIPFIH